MRIAIVTGTRAEYGIWRPVLQAVRAARGLQLQLVVTGMHLLTEFGHTVRDIEADGWKIAARVPMYSPARAVQDKQGKKGSHFARDYAAALAKGVQGMGQAFEKLKPDVVMVLGDRLEILAAATAALCQGRLIAHVHGGETAPGQFDEQIRHAVTKMAHLHFCATATAARRIIQMGENPSHVFVVGAPALDSATAALQEFAQLTGTSGPQLFASQPTSALVVLHPGSPDEKTEYQHARMILQTLRNMLPGRLQLIGPNNDPGHRGILKAYTEALRTVPNVHLEMSLTQPEFWGELLGRRLLVGNSSGGIIEAASFGAAVINLGHRQAGRERSGNVLDIPYKKADLERALKRVLSDRKFAARVATCRNVYGDGHAAERMVKVLDQINRLLPVQGRLSAVKRFYDLPLKMVKAP